MVYLEFSNGLGCSSIFTAIIQFKVEKGKMQGKQHRRKCCLSTLGPNNSITVPREIIYLPIISDTNAVPDTGVSFPGLDTPLPSII